MRSLASVAEVTADVVGGNPKSQVPNLKETPSTKFQTSHQRLFEIWSLELLWGLGFGIWDFPRSGPSQYRDSGIPVPKLFIGERFFVPPRN
jgi:hypothetical protein